MGQKMDANAIKVFEGTDIPVLLLDRNLNIAAFTSPIKQVYSILPSDVGRSIDDLRSLADDEITPDAIHVQASKTLVDRDIVTRTGQRFTRRLSLVQSPGSQNDNGIIAIYLERQAQVAGRSMPAIPGEIAGNTDSGPANLFLEAAHDLRQPLQAFALLRGLLRRAIEGERQNALLDRLDRVFAAMAETVDNLIEINQIETGSISAEAGEIEINDVLNELRDEFEGVCAQNSITLHVVPSRLSVISSRRLLRQLLRSLVLRAVRHAPSGRVLIGVRRRLGIVSVEIWDTGLRTLDDNFWSMAHRESSAETAGRGRPRGTGLSIVRRLANFLGHRIRTESHGQHLTMFAVELPLKPSGRIRADTVPLANRFESLPRGGGLVTVIEADSNVRDLLEMAFIEENYEVNAVSTIAEATQRLNASDCAQSVIIADYRTLQALSATGAISELGGELWRRVPGILLTGDIPADEQAEIDRLGLIQLKKPVRLQELCEIVHRLMPRAAPAVERRGQPREPLPQPANGELPTVCVVDDDEIVLDAAGVVFEDAGFTVRRYADGESFLASLRPNQNICLLVDAYLPGISGLDVLERFRQQNSSGVAIMITGSSDVSMAVRAMKAGAADFIEKPAYPEDLLESVRRAIAAPRSESVPSPERVAVSDIMSRLTRREQEIMRKVLEGQPSKNIALDLGISKRTVENHRAAIMKKTGSNSLPALARLGFGL
jgi:two-component system CheB/CheR fusion protein